MARRVRLTDDARRDVRAAMRWLLQDGSGVSAARRLAALDASLQGIAHAPYAYRVGPEPGTRVMVSQRYRVLYQIIPDTGDTLTAGDVFVLRLFGPGQDDT